MEVVEIRDGRAALCREILEALPEWFGDERAREAFIRKADAYPMFAALVNATHVGTLTLIEHGRWNLEIAAMGVLPAYHRQGVGRALVGCARRLAADRGIQLLSVKTIADSLFHPAYAETRAFYRRVGFEPFEELPNLWGARTPCALLVLPVGGEACSVPGRAALATRVDDDLTGILDRAE